MKAGVFKRSIHYRLVIHKGENSVVVDISTGATPLHASAIHSTPIRTPETITDYLNLCVFVY